MEICESDYEFNVLIYNNALIGLKSAIYWPNTIGMVNDYNNASRNLKNLTLNYRFFKNYIFKIFERLAINNQKTTIVNSLFLANFLSNEYSLPKSKFKVLYKGIQIPQSLNKTTIDPRNQIKVLFVKADYELGGLSILISALGKLPYEFELTVIGPPLNQEKVIKSYLKNQQNISLDFMGYQPQETVKKELLTTNIFCVPSYREGLGVANLEALSYGVPVVSTNVGGIPEILNHGACGWLVKPGDAQGLANSIDECIKNQTLRIEKLMNGVAF